MSRKNIELKEKEGLDKSESRIETPRSQRPSSHSFELFTKTEEGAIKP